MDKREPEIEELLNMARDAGISAVVGRPATRSNLAIAAHVARQTVLAQADVGMWRKWTIEDAREFAELGCEFEIAPPSLRDNDPHPIRVRWDFKRTPLRFLETA